MSWGSTNVIDSQIAIRSYAAALRHYDRVKPIRGRATEVRPIGDRRRDQFAIHKRPDNKEVYLRMYNTDVITYHEDRRVSVRTYNSTSTVQFADRHLPVGLRATSRNGTMYVDCRTAGTFGYSSYAEGIEPLVFRPCSEGLGTWELVSTPAPQTRHVLNRVRTRKIREQLELFFKYATVLQRLEPVVRVPTYARKYPDGNHRAALLTVLHNDEGFPQEEFAAFYGTLSLCNNWKESLLKEAYFLLGAYDKETLPPGVPAPRKRR